MAILGASMAQRFVDKMGKYLEYNINVMNENGIIIASRDETRIGDFHEVAYEMLHGTLETSIVNEEKKYIGTKPGVNLFIEYKNKPVGVVGVTGEPDSVKSFAGLVKISLEAMLEYEIYMEKKRTRRNKTDQFLHSLLFEENPDYNVLENLATDIELKKDMTFAALIVYVHKECDRSMVLRILRDTKGWKSGDMATIASNDNIVVLKSVESKGQTEFCDYRYELSEFVSDFIQRAKGNVQEKDLCIYVGSLQKKWELYRKSYLHAHEMFLRSKNREGVSFFEDYIVDYFRNKVTMKEYNEIFNIYNGVFSRDEQEMIAETVAVLANNNYNVVNSAKELFMHRNTLVFRLNKIKNSLHIDPINRAADREFLNELAYYFRNK